MLRIKRQIKGYLKPTEFAVTLGGRLELEATPQSAWIGIVSIAIITLIAIVDTRALTHVELYGFYWIVPLYIALKYRSRMFYPVSIFALGAYLSSQAIVLATRELSSQAIATLVANTGAEIMVATFTISLIRQLHVVQSRSVTDFLTGLQNRRGLEESAPKIIQLAQRRDLSMAAITIDVNRFKQLNDTHGHDAGDAVLRAIGLAIQAMSIRNSVAVRMGGDEFLILAAVASHWHAQSLKRALDKNLDSAIKATGFDSSVSIGLSVMRTPPETIEELLKLSDEKMYAAKAVVQSRDSARVAS